MCCESADDISYLCYNISNPTAPTCHVTFTYFSQFNRINRTFTYLEFFAFVVIFLFSSVLNLLMVHLFARRKKVRNWTNLIITAICLSRWIMSATTPFLGVTRVTESWKLGDALCKIIPSSLISFGCVTTWLLCLLSFDRYKGIVRGQPIARISRRRCLLLAFIFAVSAVMAGPSFMFFRVIETDLNDGRRVTFCAYHIRPNTKFYHLYTLILAMVGILIPLAVSTYCYVSIGHVVFTNRRRMLRTLSCPQEMRPSSGVNEVSNNVGPAVPTPEPRAIAHLQTASPAMVVRFGQEEQRQGNQQPQQNSSELSPNTARPTQARRNTMQSSTSSLRYQRGLRDQRTFAILVLTVSLFCLMNLPLAVCLIMVAIDMIDGQRHSVPSSAFVGAVIVMSANAVVNPVLYIYAGEKYREAVYEVIGSLPSYLACRQSDTSDDRVVSEGSDGVQN